MPDTKTSQTASKILVKLQKENIFTDPSKAEVLKQIFDGLSEEELALINKNLA